MSKWLQVLVTLTCLVILATAADRAWREVTATVNAVATPKEGDVQSDAFTDREAAHITITNLTSGVRYWCVRAVVSARPGGTGTGRVESVPVCSGDVSPHTTVTLIAPYPAGKVFEMCSSPGRYGRELDWSQCTFDIEPIAKVP